MPLTSVSVLAVLQLENSYNALLVALDANQDEELLPPEGFIPAGPITPEGSWLNSTTRTVVMQTATSASICMAACMYSRSQMGVVIVSPITVFRVACSFQLLGKQP